MPSPRFQVGEERTLRRPLTARSGAEVPVGTRVRVLDFEEVRGTQGFTYLYRVRVVREHEELRDLGNPDNQLELTHKKLKDHTRGNCVAVQ